MPACDNKAITLGASESRTITANSVRLRDILVTVNEEVVTPPTLPTFALGTDATVTVRPASELKDARFTIVLPKAPPNGKANAKPPMAEPTSVTARLLDKEIGYLRVA